MRRKRDMYIHYERTYRPRRTRGGKALKLILVIVIAIGLGLASFYAIKRQIEMSVEKEDISNTKIDENTEGKEEVQLVEYKGLAVAEPIKQAITENNEILATEIVKEEVNTKQEVNSEKDTRIPVKAKGIYVTSAITETDYMETLIELVDSTELNTMIIDIKDDRGKITYKMDSKLGKEIGATTNIISDINVLVKYLKEKDIYLIARIVAFKDPYLAEQRHDLAIKNKDGSVYRDNKKECWVNPYKKDVWEYLVDVATQAAAVGFDEIQFDYIRFSTGDGIENVDFGEEGKETSKEDIITMFTKYAYEQLKPLGVYVAADVYGTIISSSIDAGLVGQNYVEMAKYLDYICPMIYPSHFGEGNYGVDYPDLEPFKIVRKVLTASATKLAQIPEGEHRAIVRPWLQDFTATWVSKHQKYGALELREQIDGVYGAGYEEWFLWNGSCKYSEDGLNEE